MPADKPANVRVFLYSNVDSAALPELLRGRALGAGNKRFSKQQPQAASKPLGLERAAGGGSARQLRKVAVSPDYPEPGRVQGVVEYRRREATRICRESPLQARPGGG